MRTAGGVGGWGGGFARKGKLVATDGSVIVVEEDTSDEAKKTQRQQPISKTRAKKQIKPGEQK